MAEVFQYRAGLPSFSQVLEIITQWSEREKLSDSEREKAKEQLGACLESLEGKTDPMSEMVRGNIHSLLEKLGG